MTVLGLHFFAQASSHCRESGGPLLVVVSLVAEHGSRACGFSSCCARDQ